MKVRRLVRWAARALLLIGLLTPPAATAAFMWVATQEQERVQTIVGPMLDQFLPTGTTTETITATVP